MSINHNARLDAHDLLARFCQYLDQGLGREWSALFLPNAAFDCGSHGRWEGAQQLALVPRSTWEQTQGETRHLMNAVVVNPGATWRDLDVRAYGPVIDFSQDGRLSRFYDYRFSLRFCVRWRIRHAAARLIGESFPEFPGMPAIAELASHVVN